MYGVTQFRELKTAHRAVPDDYMAYVGPAVDYDLLGAAQFSLLVALGLRHHHALLDYGCGSLRAGRFLLPFLDPGHYYGLEPNTWLLEAALDRQLGRDMLDIKQPTFLSHDSFGTGEFGRRFDYILAHSILSHTGPGLIDRVLSQIVAGLADDGLALVTVCQARWPRRSEAKSHGWVYPEAVWYRASDVRARARAAGFHSVALRWRHPRQRWYALAHHPARLPSARQRLMAGTYPRASLRKTAGRQVIERCPPHIWERVLAIRWRRGRGRTAGS
ncbi:MAG: class I SAM-dependent methyltransferase [Actinobacteria bacterium]|nr:MAG: class I SAM-dependent methyltransferase [Actinomycetota bacterium]